MGLRCLIGHDFGDLQTERDREDRGGEEVLTVREYRECGRCGERKIISENKEVTASPDPSPDLGRAEAESMAEPQPETSTAATNEDPYDEVSAEEDDGVILTDDDTEDAGQERDRGEWPEQEDPVELDGEPQDWPETTGDDEGFAAEPTDDEPDPDVDFHGGLRPERAQDDMSAAATGTGEILEETDPEPASAGVSETGEPGPHDSSQAASQSSPEPPEPDSTRTESARDPEPTASSGITSAEASPQPTGQQRSDGETEFVCPECGHTADSVGSSLRPGDICPECHKGYLTERERQT